MARTEVKGRIIVDDPILKGTGSIKIPTGTTLERPATAQAGMIRFNTATSEFEGYNGTAWASLAGSAGGQYPGDFDGDLTVQRFVGDGITTNFQLTASALTANSVVVDINGIIQEPTQAYTVDLVNNYITFSEPPIGTDRITIRYLRELINVVTIADVLDTGAFGSTITETEDQDKVLVYDASADEVTAVTLENLGVGGEGKWTIVIANHTAKRAERIGVNSTSGSFTVYLPDTNGLPLGSAVSFADAGGDLQNNNVTIDGNGATITNLYNITDTTFILDVNGASIGMFWTGTTWRTY